MNNLQSFEELIKDRQNCVRCHKDDNLRHFDKILSMDGHPQLLSPWCPIGENSRDAEILIIGQDFGIFKYLEDARNIDGLKSKEEGNSTNKKLIKYLKLANLRNKQMYFTNAILCVKKGASNNTKSGVSMSAKVETGWFTNCSERFLKNLILHHLPKLKTIITLGKYALFSINHIVEDKLEIIKPLVDLVAECQNIHISDKKYTLIPMLHPSFDHLSAKGHKENKKAKDLWESIGNLNL